MPTPSKAFAAVAHALADVNPQDREAVTMFYRRNFVAYPMAVRALISDFLIGQTGEPSASDLEALMAAVALPPEELPEPEAPAWKGRRWSTGWTSARRRRLADRVGTQRRSLSEAISGGRMARSRFPPPSTLPSHPASTRPGCQHRPQRR